jgi:transcription-repair coupling factor (superfamily II helicase)
MFLKDLITHLKNETWFEKLCVFSNRGDTPCLISGLNTPMKAVSVALLSEKENKSAVVICKDEASASALSSDLKNFISDEEIVFIPARDLSLRSGEIASREYELLRITALSKLLGKGRKFVILSAECLIEPCIPKETLKDKSFGLKTGEEITIKELNNKLISSGYTRCETVEGVGEFQIRGGIVDIYPTGSENPVRIEFFGEEIDTITFFSPETQRRTDPLNSVLIPPCREVIYDPAELLKKLNTENSQNDKKMLESGEYLPSADKYIPLIYPEFSIISYFKDYLHFISEPTEVNEALISTYKGFTLDIETLLEEKIIDKNSEKLYMSPEEALERLNKAPLFLLDTFIRQINFLPVNSVVKSDTRTAPRLPNVYSDMKEELEGYLEDSITPIIFCGTEKSVPSLISFLIKEGVRAERYKGNLKKDIVYVTSGALSVSFISDESKVVFLSLSGARVDSPRKKLFKKGKEIASLSDLNVGDNVVHSAHGIGVFEGIVKMKTGESEKDYIKIKYAGADVLYVPVSSLDLVSRYIGGKEDSSVRLNRLSGTDWNNTKQRVKRELSDMADELIALYQKRQNAKGYPFGKDTDWQNEFEQKFEFEETDDQIRSINEIKGDMEKAVPMDRLLCGDVGFGKTEVAFRAAFKCVLDSKQVAILAPTTILAFQHYETALRRFDGYPITIELLSRFKTPKEQKEIIKKLKTGEIDILIGTHRMIGNDVSFKDLGLLIVDEEQRFGVRHKEKLKEKFVGVDVLTLSATPIPRTLNMALSGIRDMSMIEEPPKDRKPVQTFVVEEDDGIIIDALRKELRRGGCAFYLHNRVESIISTASRLSKLLPNARIGIAHGKMDEDDLSAVFESLLNAEIDILVCTTIIETGIDIPHAGTLIIEDADKMGLSQLYQIRGRVGRSSMRAYAYFMFKPQKVLSEIAAKRLQAIKDFTQFGSGFKIAMRDLEIRGAGSILGAHQHGHMENVGYDMYMKLLKQTVDEKQGIKSLNETEDCLMDLKMNAYIPAYYIEGFDTRMEIYKLIAAIESYEDKLDVTDELIDRFGDIPKEVAGLIDVAFLRKKAILFGITEIKELETNVIFYLKEINMEKISSLISVFGKRLLLNAGSKPYISLKKSENSALDTIKELLSAT